MKDLLDLRKVYHYYDKAKALEEINYTIGTTRRPTRYHFDILTPSAEVG